MTLGPNATMEEANLTIASMLGVDRQALTGRRFTQFVAPRSQDTLYLHQRQALGSDMKCTCELVLPRADATEFVTMLETVSVQDPVTGAASLRCSISDITDRKKVEEARQQLNETL
jgi:PAS domain S-box-containing protein